MLSLTDEFVEIFLWANDFHLIESIGIRIWLFGSIAELSSSEQRGAWRANQCSFNWDFRPDILLDQNNELRRLDERRSRRFSRSIDVTIERREQHVDPWFTWIKRKRCENVLLFFVFRWSIWRSRTTSFFSRWKEQRRTERKQRSSFSNRLAKFREWSTRTNEIELEEDFRWWFPRQSWMWGEILDFIWFNDGRSIIFTSNRRSWRCRTFPKCQSNLFFDEQNRFDSIVFCSYRFIDRGNLRREKVEWWIKGNFVLKTNNFDGKVSPSSTMMRRRKEMIKGWADLRPEDQQWIRKKIEDESSSSSSSTTSKKRFSLKTFFASDSKVSTRRIEKIKCQLKKIFSTMFRNNHLNTINTKSTSAEERERWFSRWTFRSSLEWQIVWCFERWNIVSNGNVFSSSGEMKLIFSSNERNLLLLLSVEEEQGENHSTCPKTWNKKTKWNEWSKSEHWHLISIGSLRDSLRLNDETKRPVTDVLVSTADWERNRWTSWHSHQLIFTRFVSLSASKVDMTRKTLLVGIDSDEEDSRCSIREIFRLLFKRAIKILEWAIKILEWAITKFGQ